MARILAQLKPEPSVLTDIFIVVSNAIAGLGNIFITNQSATATTFRISIAPGGEADSLKQYLSYDTAICSNETIIIPIRESLIAGDTLRVYSESGTCSFNLFGISFDQKT